PAVEQHGAAADRVGVVADAFEPIAGWVEEAAEDVEPGVWVVHREGKGDAVFLQLVRLTQPGEIDDVRDVHAVEPLPERVLGAGDHAAVALDREDDARWALVADRHA